MVDVSKMQFETGSWQEGVYDIYVGLWVGTAHSYYFTKQWVSSNLVKPALSPFGISLGEEKPLQNSNEGLKVVGVGYGRTGTYSLTFALEELGIPTLHTQHLYEHDDIFSMWEREVFRPSLEAGEATLRSPNFELIAAHGFQATTDLPMALYFVQVHEQYPDCKFILTVREDSEVWFKSWDTLTKSITHPARYGSVFMKSVNRISLYLRWLFSVVNNDNSYLTIPFPLPNQNKRASIASYEEHNRRVREVIPADQLLEYNVKEGWEPLCTFLEIENCPTTPFPKSNSARSVQVQAISSMIVPLVLVLFVLFYLFSALFQRATGRTVLQWANRKISEGVNAIGMISRGEKPMLKKA